MLPVPGYVSFFRFRKFSVIISSNMFSFFEIFIYLFIYFWLHWVFVVARGLSLVAVRGLFIVVASPAVEHGL